MLEEAPASNGPLFWIFLGKPYIANVTLGHDFMNPKIMCMKRKLQEWDPEGIKEKEEEFDGSPLLQACCGAITCRSRRKDPEELIDCVVYLQLLELEQVKVGKQERRILI